MDLKIEPSIITFICIDLNKVRVVIIMDQDFAENNDLTSQLGVMFIGTEK